MRPAAVAALLLLFGAASAQEQVVRKLRMPIWSFHARHKTTIGLNLGLATLLDDIPRDVRTIGVHAEVIGLGLFLAVGPHEAVALDSLEFAQRMAQVPSERIHGITTSPLGMVCDCHIDGISLNGGGLYAKRVNGISAALATNQVDLHRGVQVSAFVTFAYKAIGFQGAFVHANARILHGLRFSAINSAGEARGLQVSNYNKAEQLKGLQIGLWNVNQKRKLPLFNWG